jgi:hypothetical protein
MVQSKCAIMDSKCIVHTQVCFMSRIALAICALLVVDDPRQGCTVLRLVGDISGEVTPVAPLALMDFKNEGSRGGGGGGGDSHTCIIRKLILKCEYIVLLL